MVLGTGVPTSVFDPKNFQSRTVFKHEGTFFSLIRDTDSGRLFAGSSDSRIHVFDPGREEAEALTRWEGHENYVSALASLEGEDGSDARVVSAGYDRRLIWWEPEAGRVVRKVEDAHAGWIRDLVALPGGQRLATVGDDMLVRIRESGSGKLIREMSGHALRTPQGHVTALYAVAVSPDGRIIASGDRIGDVRLWESDTGKLVQSFQVPTLYTYDPRQRKRSMGGVRSLAFSADGKELAVGGIGQIGNVDGLGGPVHVEVWEWQVPRRRLTLPSGDHKAVINDLRFHGDPAWLIGAGGGSGNGVIALWEVSAAGRERPETEEGRTEGENAGEDSPGVPLHKVKMDGHVHAFCVHPDGSELYAAGYHKLEVWATGSGRTARD